MSKSIFRWMSENFSIAEVSYTIAYFFKAINLIFC